MEFAAFQPDEFHLFIRHFPSRRIFPPVESAGDFESPGGGGARNEFDDGFLILQRLSPPVGGDKGKEPVFDLVPLAGAGRKVANRYFQARLVGEALQLELPKSQARPVATDWTP